VTILGIYRFFWVSFNYSPFFSCLSIFFYCKQNGLKLFSLVYTLSSLLPFSFILFWKFYGCIHTFLCRQVHTYMILKKVHTYVLFLEHSHVHLLKESFSTLFNSSRGSFLVLWDLSRYLSSLWSIFSYRNHIS
jgi:hypothetical protein